MHARKCRTHRRAQFLECVGYRPPPPPPPPYTASPPPRTPHTPFPSAYASPGLSLLAHRQHAGHNTATCARCIPAHDPHTQSVCHARPVPHSRVPVPAPSATSVRTVSCLCSRALSSTLGAPSDRAVIWPPTHVRLGAPSARSDLGPSCGRQSLSPSPSCQPPRGNLEGLGARSDRALSQSGVAHRNARRELLNDTPIAQVGRRTPLVRVRAARVGAPPPRAATPLAQLPAQAI